MGLSDNTITLRITGDAKSFRGAVKDTKASLDDLGKAQKALNDQYRAGSIGLSQWAAASAQISTRTKQLGGEVVSAAGAMAQFGGSTRTVQRELGILAGELLRGNYSAFERSLVTLTRQTGLLSAAINFLSGPIGLVAVGLGVLTAGYIAGAKEQDRFARSIAAVGDYAGVTAGDLSVLRNQIGGSAGEYAKAADALNLLVMSGKVAGQALGDAGRAAVALSDLTGQSIEKAVAEIEKLGTDAPAAIAKLNEQYHFLTQAQYDNIKSLEDQGRAQDASAAAFKAAADAFSSREKGLEEQAGTLAKAYNEIARTASAAWQAIKDIGRTDIQSQIDALTGKLVLLQKGLETDQAYLGRLIPPYQYEQRQKEIDQLEQTIIGLTKERDAQQASTQAKAEDAKITSDGIAASAKLDDALTKHADKATKEAAAIKELNAEFQAMFKAQELAYQQDANAALNPRLAGVTQVGDAFQGGAYATALENIHREFKQSDPDAKLYEHTLADLNEQIAKGTTLAADLANQLSGPLEAATRKHTEQLAILKADQDALDAERALGIIDAQKYADATKVVTAAMHDSDQVYQDTTRHIAEQNDVVGNYLRKISEETALVGLSDRERAIAQALDGEIDKWKKLTEAERQQEIQLGHLNPTTAAGEAAIRGATGALYDMKKAEDLNKQATSELAGIFKQSFDAILTTSGNLWTRLKAGFKNLIESIIQYFARLAIINPILNAIFGGSIGFSALPTAANAAGVFGGGGGGGIGSLFGFGGGGPTTSGAAGGSLFSPSSWIDAGKSLWQGFSSFFGGGTTPVGNPLSPDFVGPPGETAAYYGPPAAGAGPLGYGGYGSALGQGLGIAGGVFAGYNEFKNAGGGAAGLLGAAAYGVGTYFAGAAITSAFAGGISAGLAAVPVVGWIAIAAMLIDKFSGGKLFGTKWQTRSSDVSLNIGPGGGDATTTVFQTKQGAFFSGLKKQTKTIGSSQDAIDAAQQLFDSVHDTMVAAANQLKVEVPPVIDASIETVTQYDKKGHATSTKILVDAFGKQWEEASVDLAAKRVQADAIISTIAATTVGKDAIAISQQFQKSADTLADAAALMLGATVDIQSGHGLLGLNSTLADTVAEVVKLKAGDESLVQAYIRLQQETTVLKAIYDQIGLTATKSGAAFVDFADEMVKAAGSLDALRQLWTTYYSAFYTAQEQTANKLAQDRKASDEALTAIGESTTVTMAQFRQDFEAALPTLTGDQVVQWLKAAAALAQITGDLQQVAQAQAQAQAAYTSFIGQFKAVLDPLSQFEGAIIDLGGSLAQNIAKANALAQAAGAAGASTDDLTTILLATAQQGAAYVVKLQQEVTQAAGQLFGTGADQIKAQIDALRQHAADFFKTTGLLDSADTKRANQLQAQLDQQNAAAEAQQKFVTAVGILADLGQLGAVTQESLAELAKQSNIPLDKFAKLLGTDAAGLQKDFDQQVAIAKAALDTAGNTEAMKELLADIRATLLGLPLPYGAGAVSGASTGVYSAAGGKTGPGTGYTPPFTLSDIYLHTKTIGTSGRDIPPTPPTTKPKEITAPIVEAIGAGNALMTQLVSEARKGNRSGLPPQIIRSSRGPGPGWLNP